MGRSIVHWPTEMPETDEELLAFLNQRDMRGAAACLVGRHADEVYGLCRAMVRDDVVAEDLSQDVFGRAFSALASFRGDASSRTWILRIARNRCIDYLRSVQRQPWGSDDDASAEEEPGLEPRVDDLLVRHGDVRRGLAALTEGERAMVMLRFGHGLEYAELADTFGLREGAVRMRVSRAVTKMREALRAVPVGAPPPAASAPTRARSMAASIVRDQERSERAAPRPKAPPAAWSPAPQAPERRSPGAAPPASGLGSAGLGGGHGQQAPAAAGRPASPFASSASEALRARLSGMAGEL